MDEAKTVYVVVDGAFDGLVFEEVEMAVEYVRQDLLHATAGDELQYLIKVKRMTAAEIAALRVI